MNPNHVNNVGALEQAQSQLQHCPLMVDCWTLGAVCDCNSVCLY